MLLVTIPTLAAVILGGFTISSSLLSARSYQQAETLATLGQRAITLAQALEEERDQTVYYIALASSGGRADGLSGNPAVRSQAALALSVVQRAASATQQAASGVRALASQIGGSYSAQAQQAASTALTALRDLPYLRQASLSTQLPSLAVVQKYTQVIDDVLGVNDQVAQGVGDPALAQTVRVLGLVSAMKEEASQQRAILAAALLQHGFGAGQLAALNAAQSAQQGNLAAFNISANVSQRQLWNQAADRSYSYLANSDELQALSLQSSTGSLRTDPTTAVDWFGAMSNTIDFQMGGVEHRIAAQAVSRAATLRRDAIVTALVVGAAVLFVLLLALISIIIVGRSMVRPLRQLRAGALEVAGVGLPEAVRRMNEQDAAVGPLTVEPIGVDSTDEIGEVARAFDQVHREALRLAANEAALRGNVNAMFVNLSRRSQSLVERQIRLIDTLEQSEQDAERLGSLFQMDHLATRMRRNSENLLVLAGHDIVRRWNQPVALVDVLRAAVSEIEQYERVSLNVQPGISVRGQAVNDIVHLTAELVENATAFSPADSPVSITGHLLGSGGVLLEITDQGVGVGADEMAHANWRLDNPPVVDVAVSRRMGLFVVARLAARHGIRVRLRSAPSGGLTALVWLPDEVIGNEGASPGDRWHDAGDATVSPAVIGEWDAAARSAAEQEVNAARTPRFTPLRADASAADSAQADPDLDRGVPGAEPRQGGRAAGDDWSSSGNWIGSTGPMPVFRTSPQPAPRPESELPAESVNGAAGNGTAANGAASTAAPWITGPNSAFGSDIGDDDSASQMPADPADASAHPDSPAAAVPPTTPAPAALPKRDAQRGWTRPADQMTRPSVDMFSKGASSPAAADPGTDGSAGADADQADGGGSAPMTRFASRFTGFGRKPDTTGPADPDAADGSDGSAATSEGDSATPADLVPSPGSGGGEESGHSGPADDHQTSDDRAPAEDAPVAGQDDTSAGGPPGPDGDDGQRDGQGDRVRRNPQNGGSSFGSVVIPPAAGMAEETRLPIFEQVESDWFRRGRPSVTSASSRSEAAGFGRTNGGSLPPGDAASAPAAPAAEQATSAASTTASVAEPPLSAEGPTADTSLGHEAVADGPEAEAGTVPAGEGVPDAADEITAGGGWTSPGDEGWRAAEAVSEPTSGGLTSAGLPKRVPRANLVPGTVGAESGAPAPARSAAATRDRLTSFQRGVRQARATSAEEQPGSGESDDDS